MSRSDLLEERAGIVSYLIRVFFRGLEATKDEVHRATDRLVSINKRLERRDD
jgi:hypothetical protein